MAYQKEYTRAYRRQGSQTQYCYHARLPWHARTLEFYRQMGIDYQSSHIAASVEFGAVHLWVGQKEKGAVQLGGAAKDISPYPYIRIFPQDEHEAILEQQL